jgi:hypothetical protein
MGVDSICSLQGWAYRFMASSGALVYVSAENQQDHGDVQATIYINGDVLDTDLVVGAFGIATASGNVP